MNNSLPLVEVFILSYNRPEYILQTIDSVLQQSYPNLKIIVSDNSTKDDVEKKIQDYNRKSEITYIRRRPSLPALTHFNTVFSEVRADYFIVFHDDDVMLPQAVNKLVEAITGDTNCAATGSNAFLLEEKVFTQNVFAPHLTKNRTLSTPEDLGLHYLDASKGHVPFHYYIYRTNKVRGLEMNFKEGHKHADVSFLLKAAQRGSVMWIKDELIYYRRHSQNDSANVDIPAVFSLCRFLLKRTNVPPEAVKIYKMKNYLAWAKQKRSGISKSLSPWRDHIIKKANLNFLITHPRVVLKFVVKRFSQQFHALVQMPKPSQKITTENSTDHNTA